MIEFMVLGLPRCGTTWASNWLTTESTLCLHDPLWTNSIETLDSIASLSGKQIGLSCSAIGLYTEYVNTHPARKIMLTRPLKDINASLEAIGLSAIHPNTLKILDRINARRYNYQDLFNYTKAQEMYEYLLAKPFDQERYTQLIDMEIQPHFPGLTIGPETTRKFSQEIFNILSLEHSEETNG